MKRFILLLLSCLASVSVFAQDASRLVHASAGLAAGTTGIAAEASAIFGGNFAVRLGFNYLRFGYPFRFSLPEDLGGDGSAASFTAKLNLNHGCFLADIYPFAEGSFHFTGGLWAGSPNLVRLSNSTPLPDAFNSIGIDIDGYSVHAMNNDLSADIRVNALKPYFGFGFGKIRPDRRLCFVFDLGLLWWGSPGVFTSGYDILDEEKEVQLTSTALDNVDKGMLDKASRLLFYPVMRCTVAYRFF